MRSAHEQFPEKVGVVRGEQRSMYAQFAQRSAGVLPDAGQNYESCGEKL
jgi:hypothetical protein